MTNSPLNLNTDNTATRCRLQDASCPFSEGGEALPPSLTLTPSKGVVAYSSSAHPRNSSSVTLPCDAWHHYYHYQSSTQYLWLVKTLQILGKEQEAITACDKALFQDHFNQQALEAKAGNSDFNPTSYDKHSLSDAEFCISIGEKPDASSELHDEAVANYLAGNYDKVLALLAVVTDHSNSYFLRGKCLFALKQYEEASKEFTEAIRLSHVRHDAYHHFASDEHLKRGNNWFKAGEIELAINDFTKALDLHSQNKDARKARALAYKAKGNLKLATQDEAMS